MPLAPSMMRHLVDDLVAPIIVAHQGGFVLHGGATRHENRAVLFIGESGHGKSTLVADFDRAGYPLLGDDAVMVTGLPDLALGEATYASLRLLPDSIAAVLPSARSEAVSEFSDKHRVLRQRERHEPLPIRCVFLIAPRTEEPAITFRRLTDADACITLITNSFALDPTDPGRAHGRLKAASALARKVPVIELHYPRDYALLPEVRQAILDHIASLEPA